MWETLRQHRGRRQCWHPRRYPERNCKGDDGVRAIGVSVTFGLWLECDGIYHLALSKTRIKRKEKKKPTSCLLIAKSTTQPRGLHWAVLRRHGSVLSLAGPVRSCPEGQCFQAVGSGMEGERARGFDPQ